MKVVIVTSAVLALSATAAMADCKYHSAKTSTPVDTQQTSASVETKTQEEKLLAQRTDVQQDTKTPVTIK